MRRPTSPANARKVASPLLRLASLALPWIALSSCQSLKSVPEPSPTWEEPTCRYVREMIERQASGLQVVRCAAIEETAISIPLLEEDQPTCASSRVRADGDWHQEVGVLPFVLRDASESGTGGRTVSPPPGLSLRFVRAGVAPALGCDMDVERAYFGHPLLGFVAAFDISGTELWRLDIPEFETVVDRADPSNADHLVALLQQQGSLLLRVVPSGTRIAVQYRHHGQRWHLIVHRTGRIEGRIGPWDAFIKSVTMEGWTFVFRRASTLDAPTEEWYEVELRQGESPTDLFVEHALAALMPYPDDRTYVWRSCDPGNPILRQMLGARFDPSMARLASAVGRSLGPDWFLLKVNRGALASLLAKPAARSPEWRAAVRRALLDAGTDVDVVREWLRGQRGSEPPPQPVEPLAARSRPCAEGRLRRGGNRATDRRSAPGVQPRR